MKNTLFSIFLTSIVSFSTTMAAHAQQVMKASAVFADNQPNVAQQKRHMPDMSRFKNNSGNARTTSSSGWFSYADVVLSHNIALGENVGFLPMFMWQDSAGSYGYSNLMGCPGYTNLNSYMVSCGLLFDPQAFDWPSGMQISPDSSYVIDSVVFGGVYGRPPGATYIDTLRIATEYGNITDSPTNVPMEYFNESVIISDYSLSSMGDSVLWFPDWYWDSTQNQVTNYGSLPGPTIYNALLGPADTNVASYGTYGPYPVNITIPAGNFAMTSISFRSGASPAFASGDTIIDCNGTFHFGAFEPLVAFAESGDTVDFPPYLGPGPGPFAPDTADYTTGYYMSSAGGFIYPWSQYYQPNWEFSNGSTGGGYYLQYPYVLFHATSAPRYMLAVNTPGSNEHTVNVYPNPANDVININFSLASAASVSVSLTNVMGQVVSEQHLDNVSTGKTVINTASIPAGMYFYTFTANGKRTTGKILIAH